MSLKADDGLSRDVYGTAAFPGQQGETLGE